MRSVGLTACDLGVVATGVVGGIGITIAGRMLAGRELVDDTNSGGGTGGVEVISNNHNNGRGDNNGSGSNAGGTWEFDEIWWNLSGMEAAGDLRERAG